MKHIFVAPPQELENPQILMSVVGCLGSDKTYQTGQIGCLLVVTLPPDYFIDLLLQH